MSHIKIFRLKSGDDIICFFELIGSTITLIHPVNFFINYNLKNSSQELMMNFWLPVNVIEENRISIPFSEVLLELTPKKEFKEYYLNFLNGFEKISDEQIDREQIQNLLHSSDAKHLNKIH